MSKKYQVLRTFPDKRVLSRGAIVTDPEWRNLPQLIRNGYIKEIEEDNNSEISLETPVETAPVMNEAEITEPAVIDETPADVTVNDVTEDVEESAVETDIQTQAGAENQMIETAAQETGATVPVVDQTAIQTPVENKTATAKAKSKKKK